MTEWAIPADSRPVVTEIRDHLSVTAFLVLGIIATSVEAELSVAQIKRHAEALVRQFYSPPATSHIRRELNTMLDLNLLGDREVRTGRRVQVMYFVTPLGRSVARSWVEESKGTEQAVVIKHIPVLKLWLAGDADADHVLAMIDAHSEWLVKQQADAAWWHEWLSQQLDARGAHRPYLDAVSNYAVRAVGFEIENFRALREEILLDQAVHRTATKPPTDPSVSS